MKKAFALLVLLVLAACGSGLSGVYEDKLGVTRYTFHGNGKVYQSTLGFESEMQYELDGDKIKIGSGDSLLILTLNPDGTIGGPLGITLHKKPE